jgi:hypothetical protein
VMSICGECCVLSSRGLCDGPITLPEESYRVCVCVCLSLTVIMCGHNPLHLEWEGTKRSQQETKKEFLIMIISIMLGLHNVN